MSASRVELSNRIRAQQAAQQAQRNELLGTPNGESEGRNPFVPVARDDMDQMDNRQLMQYGVNMHKDTTAATNNMRKIVDDTQEVAAATQAALYHQGKQIDVVNGNLKAMKEDLTYAQRLLRYMRKCCCCACCGDPELQTERDYFKSTQTYQEDVNAREAAKMGEWKEREAARADQPSSYMEAQRLKSKYKGATYGGPDTSRIDRNQYGEEADEIDQETKKQDDNLAYVERGLDNLMSMAKNMREEVGRQDEKVYGAQVRADTVGTGLYDVNHKSQLRQFGRR